MFGLMMDRPLLLSSLLEHAEQQFPDVEIVSRETHGPLFRYTYRDLGARSRRLAKALAALGMARGTRVATVAWNNHRHLEAYFAVSGSGAVPMGATGKVQKVDLRQKYANVLVSE
ncbi:MULTISPECIES: AMP-binding protein [unclassified Variovorax]|uniref:AMP-binding protein n=1 Tax=Variovorax sp. dw_308 TaxID=2721546 RepID=UPI001BD404A8